MVGTMKIYTKTGDKGETGLLGGKRVSKWNLRIWAIGEIDELSAVIGVIRPFGVPKKMDMLLGQIQEALFVMGAEISSPQKNPNLPSLQKSETEKLEKIIDEYDAKLPELRNFILPSGSKTGSLLHLARTVCRRAERRVVELSQKENISENIIPYLNRLSDLLFVLARSENKRFGKKDTLWIGSTLFSAP